MRLDGQDVVLFLTEDGRRVLREAGINPPEGRGIAVRVEANDELGIWIRVRREQEDHLILVRWQFVQTVDILPARRAPIGLS